jgi:hypothetical protein
VFFLPKLQNKSEKVKSTVTITQLLPVEEANNVCSQFGGQMTEPENEQELLQVFSNVNQNDFAVSCTTNTTWVGIKRSLVNKSVWLTLTNQSSKYLPWFQGEPNGEITDENCVGAFLFTKKIYDIKCDEKRCFSCEFQREVLYKLRGLCFEQETIDTDYIFLVNQIPYGNLIFQGILGKTLIMFDKTTKTWNIKSQKLNVILGIMDGAKYFETPVGTKNWTRVAQCDYNFEPNIRLRLTKVSQNQYYFNSNIFIQLSSTYVHMH